MCKNFNKEENYIFKIGLCDDDLPSLSSIIHLLEAEFIKQHFPAKFTLVTNKQDEILDAIKNHQIDVLFLDIDFKDLGMNGLQFATLLRKFNKDFFLIFLTAHQRYMPVSFYTNVFDYLVKPLSKDVLSEIVSRLKDEFPIKPNLFISLSKWTSIRASDILYIEKFKNKSVLMTEFGEYSTSKSLDSLLDELPSNFRKCHRSYIVNILKIVSIDKKNKYAYFDKNIKCPINSFFEM